jgi:hypothetical protein
MNPAELAQAGPVAILLVGIALLFRAFIRGDIVPGHIYLKEVERGDTATTQAERNVAAIAANTKVAQEILRLVQKTNASSG